MQILAVIMFIAAILSGCSAAQIQATNTKIAADLPTSKQMVQTAINLYAIDKGIALVAEIADPALIPLIAPVILIADPLVAAAQLSLNDANADATAVAALATQIQAQANSLIVIAAPAVKAIPAVSVVK